MKIQKLVLIASISILTLIFLNSSIAIGLPKPGKKPGGQPGAAPPLPFKKVYNADSTSDTDCYQEALNTLKNCINDCPELDMESSDPDLEGAKCIVKCMETCVSSLSDCD